MAPSLPHPSRDGAHRHAGHLRWRHAAQQVSARGSSRPVRWSLWLGLGVLFGLAVGFAAGLAKPRIRQLSMGGSPTPPDDCRRCRRAAAGGRQRCAQRERLAGVGHAALGACGVVGNGDEVDRLADPGRRRRRRLDHGAAGQSRIIGARAWSAAGPIAGRPAGPARRERLEAIGSYGPTRPARCRWPGWRRSVSASSGPIRSDPRLRMELQNTVRWRPDLECGLEPVDRAGQPAVVARNRPPTRTARPSDPAPVASVTAASAWPTRSPRPTGSTDPSDRPRVRGWPATPRPTSSWSAVASPDCGPRCRRSRRIRAASSCCSRATRIADGASGRNGGFCAASITHGLANGHDRFPDELPTLLRMGDETLDAIEAAIDRHGIDCDFERTGELTVAVADWQADGLAEEYALARSLGRDRSSCWTATRSGPRWRRRPIWPACTTRAARPSSTRPGWPGGWPRPSSGSACGSSSRRPALDLARGGAGRGGAYAARHGPRGRCCWPPARSRRCCGGWPRTWCRSGTTR